MPGPILIIGSESGGTLGVMQIFDATRERGIRTSPVIGQVVRFAAIGIVSTLAYVALYAALRVLAAPLVANAMALLVTAVGNTAANRRLTFGVRDRDTVLRDQLAGLLAFAVALGITSGSVLLLGALAPGAGRTTEIAVLITANVAATVVRFLLLRSWIAQPPRTQVEDSPTLGALDRSQP